MHCSLSPVALATLTWLCPPAMALADVAAHTESAPLQTPAGASPAPVALPTVEIRAAQSPAALAADAVHAARADIARRAGGTAVIDAASYANGRASTATDALAFAPGVLSQSRAADETRLSVRGSGIQRGFLMRGLQLYQDGIPLNHADGSGDFQALDPMAAQYVEVWRGANALEYGANGLGGAINFVSPTGWTAPPLSVRTLAGSLGQRQVQSGVAHHGPVLDSYLSASHSQQDGYRVQSGSRAQRFFGNLGMQLSDTLQARVFLAYLDSEMQMPGSLTRAAMQADPRQAAPHYARLRATNDYTLQRAALRLAWQPSDATRWTTSAYVTERDRHHSMTVGILQQDMRDTGLDTRLVTDLGHGGLARRITVGASFARQTGSEQRFTNVGGSAGTPTGGTGLTAQQYTLYAEYAHALDDRWTLQAGAQAVRAERRLRNASQPSVGYDVAFTGLSPKLGVLYALDAQSQLFANVSGSFEAPPFGELVVSPTLPLARDQGATTLEAGYRRRAGDWLWDVAVYRSHVRRELLSLTDTAGVALGTVNADRTVHQGVELSATAPLTPSLLLRTQYLLNDFRFDGDRVYGHRRLAGIPPHLLRADLKWTLSPQLFLTPGVEWLPQRTWVDHANTVAASGYALLNLTVGGTLGRNWSWFVEGRNLTNRSYTATTAVQANVRGADGAYYFPGDGRAVYAGLTWRMP